MRRAFEELISNISPPHRDGSSDYDRGWNDCVDRIDSAAESEIANINVIEMPEPRPRTFDKSRIMSALCVAMEEIPFRSKADFLVEVSDAIGRILEE